MIDFEKLAKLPELLEEGNATLKAFTQEIATLNTNLEALALLAERWQGVPEILGDMREMTAGLLGWKVRP